MFWASTPNSQLGPIFPKNYPLTFHQNKLTSKKLVQFYIREIERLNPVLRAVIEVNPDAVKLARKADLEREANATVSRSLLHGIPILVKDNIATKDKMNTTAGSYALLGSVVPRDAGVVVRLRKAGAIILGKASLSEWAHGRSPKAPSGWCARTGQAVNPYVESQDPCGSSTGSAISVAANLAAISLGTETDGSILCPSSFNSVVGIKPTVGLTSRGGVIPLTPRQDTVGFWMISSGRSVHRSPPICRTVSDAAYVLDAIVGYDRHDAVATREASKYIPNGGYVQFLKPDGLRGKRLGISNYLYFGFPKNSGISQLFKQPLQTLRQGGAILVDHIKIPNYETIKDSMFIGEQIAMTAELKLSLNAYLKGLITSPVRSLTDIIAFNNKFSDLEKIGEYGQDDFLESEKTNGIGELEKKALLNLTRASKYGFERLMGKYKLDALVTPFAQGSPVLAIGGYPGIIVPAGYDEGGTPYGICFGGLRGSEPKLIEIAYGFEQASKVIESRSVVGFTAPSNSLMLRIRLLITGYKNIANQFLDKTELLHLAKQMKNKFDNLKKDWVAWKKLENASHGLTGLGYDHEMGLFIAPDHWWAKMQAFRTKPLEHLDLIEWVYSGQAATGKHAWTPTEVRHDAAVAANANEDSGIGSLSAGTPPQPGHDTVEENVVDSSFFDDAPPQLAAD
ncbi:unnamed protein product [Camellia sinensis]